MQDTVPDGRVPLPVLRLQAGRENLIGRVQYANRKLAPRFERRRIPGLVAPIPARIPNASGRTIHLVAVTGVGTRDEVARVKAGTFDDIFLKSINADDPVWLVT
jgi:hypothetical protein